MIDFKEPVSDAEYQASMADVRLKLAAAYETVGRDRMPMIVIYGQGTTDFPGVFAARLFQTLPKSMPTDVVVTAASLQELRSLVPPGLACLTRSDNDDPHIIETWL